MEDIEIRKVKEEDLAHLTAISRQTFLETFAALNTRENMEKYLEEYLTLERLGKELNNKDSEFYFALADQNAVGYLKLNFGNSQTELKEYKSLEIERIYVLESWHGKGIGQLLFNTALEVAGKAQSDFIWLGVWEKNQKAIKFYKKIGFVEFGSHIFKLGDDEQTDLMMKLDLRK